MGGENGQEAPSTAPQEASQAERPGAAQEEAAKEPEAAELREKWLRARADLENVRKRTASQIRAAAHHERRTILTAFLEVLDNLERALEAHAGEVNEWVEGTRGIFQQTIRILKGFDVEPFDAMGQPFDPNLHEAVSRLEAPDQPEGTVVEVLQAGYRFTGGPLLRPARVVVSYLPPAQDAGSES